MDEIFFARPAGLALWEDAAGVLLESTGFVNEVKIIGVKTDDSGNKKILVWKNYKSGPKPAWISSKNLHKHASDLMDPPEGTTDEYPPVGDISDPASFTGSTTDIKPLPGKETVPEMGADVWVPSVALKNLAKKVKAMGLKPQDTFQKAVAAGEPIPKEIPKAVGLSGLPKADEPAKAPETPPEAPKEPEAPEPPAEPEAPPEAPAEPAKPALVMTPDEVAQAAKAGDIDKLDQNAEKLGIKGREELKKAALGAHDSGDYEKAAKLAGVLAKAFEKTKGASHAFTKAWADKAQEFAKKASGEEPAPPEPEKPKAAEPGGPIGDDAIQAASVSGDWSQVVASAKELTPEQINTVTNAFNAASAGDDHKKAASVAEAMAEIQQARGEDISAKFWKEDAEEAKKLAGLPVEMSVPQVKDAVEAGDIATLKQNATKLGAARKFVAADMEFAIQDGNWSKASELASILSDSYKEHGIPSMVESYAQAAESYKKKAEDQAAAKDAVSDVQVDDALSSGNYDAIVDNATKLTPHQKSKFCGHVADMMVAAEKDPTAEKAQKVAEGCGALKKTYEALGEDTMAEAMGVEAEKWETKAKEAQPSPMDDSEIDQAVSDGNYQKLINNATKLSADQIDNVKDAHEKLFDVGEYEKASDLAKAISEVETQLKDDYAATQWAKKAQQLGPGFAQNELSSAIASGDTEAIKKNADSLGLDEKYLIANGAEEAAEAGEYEKAANLLTALAEVQEQKGEEKSAQKLKAKAKNFQAQADHGEAFSEALAQGDADYMVANAEKLSAQQRGTLGEALTKLESDQDWGNAAKIAEAIAESYKHEDSPAAPFWENESKKYAKLAGKEVSSPVPEPFNAAGNLTPMAVNAALDKGDLDFLAAHAGKLQDKSGVLEAYTDAQSFGDWGKAAKIAGVMVAHYESKLAGEELPESLADTYQAVLGNWQGEQAFAAEKMGKEAPPSAKAAAEAQGESAYTKYGYVKAAVADKAAQNGDFDFLMENASKMGKASLGKVRDGFEVSLHTGKPGDAAKFAAVMVAHYQFKKNGKKATYWKEIQDEYAAEAGGAEAGEVPSNADVDKLAEQYSAAHKANDFVQAANVAKKLSGALAAKGDAAGAELWGKLSDDVGKNVIASAVSPDAEESKKIGDELFDASLSIGKVTELAEKDLSDSQVMKLEEVFQQALEDEDHGKAAQVAEALSKIHKDKGNEATAEKWAESAAYHKDLAEKKPEDPYKPKAAEPAPTLEEMEASGVLVLPWNAKPAKGKEHPTAAQAASAQGTLGLAVDEFVHPVSKEVWKVVGIIENEYIDPNDGIVYDKKTGKPIKGKGKFNIVETGKSVEGEPAEAAPSGPTENFPMPEPAPPPAPPTPVPSSAKDAVDVIKATPLPKGVPSPEDLTLEGSANHLGGAGTKYTYTDKDGNKWLHKHAYAKGSSSAAKPYAMMAQQVWSQVALRARGEHLPIAAMEVSGPGGKKALGTLQPLVERDAKQPDLRGVDPKTLSDEDRSTIAKEHVLDWLMSQHDSHAANFIRRAEDGKIFSVDKEQGFRFFGSDKLSIDYAPNSDLYGENPPFYNKVWSGWVKGDYDMDPKGLQETVEKIDAIPVKEYIDMMKPYAETMWPGKPDKQLEFLKAARRRKLDIRKDFERFFTELYRKKTGDDGNFTFDAGWSGDKPSEEGPKVIKHTVSAKDYIKVFASEHDTTMKWEEFDDPQTGKDPSKLTVKVANSDTNGQKKLEKMLAKTGVSPLNTTPVKGGYYTMLFVNAEEFNNATVDYEEIQQPVKPGDIAPTPKTPRYFPDDYEHAVASSNTEEIKNLQNISTGRGGKRYESDGTAVEGSSLRARRYEDKNGSYFGFQFKLRPEIWEALRDSGTGEPSTLKFKQSEYIEAKDAYVETGSTIDTANARRWAVGSSDIHLVPGSEDNKSSDKYSYVGMVQAKVRPKPGQSPYDALAELLEEMKPGLAKDVLRTATPEEKEIWKLSQLLWARAPQMADKLEEKDRTVKNLRKKLKSKGVSQEEIENTELREVLPGFSTHVEKGRWKKLREKGARFVFHGADLGSIVSIVQRGALGINERNAAGVPKTGVSYSQDVKTGSGDGVLGYVAHSAQGGKSPGSYSFSKQVQVIFDPRELERLDAYMHYGDCYGTCTPYNNGTKSGSVWNKRQSLEKRVEGLASQGSSHEISFRRGISPTSILRLNVANETTRKKVIKDLRAAGIEEVNGLPVEDLVVVGGSNEEIYKKYVEPMMTERRNAA